MKFRVVAERPAGGYYNGELVKNPFLIRDVFSPALTARKERRTWQDLEAKSEKELRRLFSEYTQTIPDGRGFVIVSVEALSEERSDEAPPGAHEEPER